MTLIDRLSKLDRPDNGIDVLIEIALFEPTIIYTAIRANSAGTKVIYTKKSGDEETYWPKDYTITPESRAKYIDRLRAKEASHGE